MARGWAAAKPERGRDRSDEGKAAEGENATTAPPGHGLRIPLEQQRQGWASLDRTGGVAGSLTRDGLGIDDGKAPLVELDPLGQ